jgi:hypothetical protein
VKVARISYRPGRELRRVHPFRQEFRKSGQFGHGPELYMSHIFHASYLLRVKQRVTHDVYMPKRTTPVTVMMSPEDLELFTEVANRIWPRSIMTRSSIVLALARIGAESVSPAKPAKKKAKKQEGH